MKTGTKTLIYGVHNPLLHGAFILVAWRKLFGQWPKWQELVCILIHDIGYWGCETVESKRGQEHPRVGAKWAGALFGEKYRKLVAGHSRHYAKTYGYELSDLFPADKYSFCLMPWWIYILLAKATGELSEYVADMEEGNYGFGRYKFNSVKEWHRETSKQIAKITEKYMAGKYKEIIGMTKEKG